MSPARFNRIRNVLDRRQPDLTVFFDNVHKPHNFSAILRTCDAVGVFEAHGVWPDPKLRPPHHTSGGSAKWIAVTTHRSCEEGLSHLRSRGLQICAADPSPDAVDFRHLDYTQPTALVLGSELEGLSDAALSLCDAHVAIPMLGMAASLNVSVAAAIILFEAQRQRARDGLYDRSHLEPEIYERATFEWAHPEVARFCRSRSIPYPKLSEAGEIVGPIGVADAPN